MPSSIDDPLRAREAQIENDRRQEVLPRKVRKTLVSLSELGARLMKAKGELSLFDSASAVSKAFSDLIEIWTNSNERYLIEGILLEIRRLETMYNTVSEGHKAVLETEWPSTTVL